MFVSRANNRHKLDAAVVAILGLALPTVGRASGVLLSVVESGPTWFRTEFLSVAGAHNRHKLNAALLAFLGFAGPVFGFEVFEMSGRKRMSIAAG